MLEHTSDIEEQFLAKVWGLVENHIRYLNRKAPYTSFYKIAQAWVEKLEAFQKYLSSIDQWNARPTYAIIAEKNKQLDEQNKQINKLTAKLEELKKHEVSQKISIEDNALPTLIDLFKQMSELTLPSGRSFLRCDYKSPYYKLISKYFSQDGKSIAIESVRNYFVAESEEVNEKGTPIRDKDRLYTIKPLKQPEK